MSANCPLGNCGLVFFDEAQKLLLCFRGCFLSPIVWIISKTPDRYYLSVVGSSGRRPNSSIAWYSVTLDRIALKSRMKLGAFSSACFDTSLDLLMTNDDKDLII